MIFATWKVELMKKGPTSVTLGKKLPQSVLISWRIYKEHLVMQPQGSQG
jgi:hypothetical protein